MTPIAALRPATALALLALLALLPLWPRAVPAQGLPARAADALQVAVWAASCAACHGPDGRAEGPGLMLAGRTSAELEKALLDYKHGRRSATVMHQHARGYSDEELRLIARHFAQLPPPAR